MYFKTQWFLKMLPNVLFHRKYVICFHFGMDESSLKINGNAWQTEIVQWYNDVQCPIEYSIEMYALRSIFIVIDNRILFLCINDSNKIVYLSLSIGPSIYCASQINTQVKWKLLNARDNDCRARLTCIQTQNSAQKKRIDVCTYFYIIFF